jgi:hypothetical protein
MWTSWFANYCPRLLHWYVTQMWLPSVTIAFEKNPPFFTKNDIDVLKTLSKFEMFSKVKSCMSYENLITIY